MCAAFAENGHAVTLFAHPFQGAQDIFGNYSVKQSFDLCLLPRLKIPVFWNFFYVRSILRTLRKMPHPDIFYGRYVYALSACVDRYPHAGLVYESHYLPPNRFQYSVEKCLFSRKNFAALVVISDVLKQDYLAAFPGLSAEKIIVAHDGADPGKAEDNRETVLRSAPGRLKIGYAGKLSTGKGMAVIGALAALCPDKDFHIFGGWPGEVECWRKRISAANVFFHGHLPHGRLPGFYRQMDILLAPLQRANSVGKNYDIGRWTSPLKIFEYMAYAKPIIASDLPTLREIIRDGENGLLVNPEDPQAWQDAINRLASDSALAQRIGARAAADLEEKYAWRVRAQNVLKKACP
jgi:glycosyltransferase involved in cell wall biosynthesis